jgi:ubiquinone biosynthesis protein UbiJ
MSALDVRFFILIEAEQLRIKRNHRGAIDAAIKGPPYAFIQTWLHGPQSGSELEITGDIHLIQTLNEIFSQVDIDWEEKLASYSGDQIAHQIGYLSRQSRDWFQTTRANFIDNLSEYIQEEIQLLPPRLAIEGLLQDIDILRDDITRLEARAHNFKQGNNKK